MKKFLFALVGTVLIFSCNDPGGTNDDSNAANKNTENSKEIYRAIETGDVSKLDSFIAEDILDHNGAPNGADIKGRDSVKHTISQIHTYFDGLKIEYISDATSADGSYHFALTRMTGKAKENPWGMPVGMDVDDLGVDVVKMRDGKATEHWGFMSWGDINEMTAGMKQGMQPTMKDTTKNK